MTTTIRARLSLAALLACALASLACTHTIEVRSEPPGADVLLDGEPVGQTPLTLERQTSHADVRSLVVRTDGQEARLALLEDGWLFEPILAGFALMGGLVLAGIAAAVAGYVMLVASLILLPSLGAGAVAFVVIGAALLYGGVLASSFAVYAPFLAIGEFARGGPDEVFVDFRRGRVTTSPKGHAEPLIGVSEGYRPLDWQPNGDRDDEHDEEPGQDDDEG